MAKNIKRTLMLIVLIISFIFLSSNVHAASCMSGFTLNGSDTCVHITDADGPWCPSITTPGRQYVVGSVDENGKCVYTYHLSGENYASDGSSSNQSNNSGEIRLDYSSICSTTNMGIRRAFKAIGYVVAIAKWIVPLIIIVLGMIDFGKVVISDDDKAMGKATGALIRRFIAAIVVFVAPTVILSIVNIIPVMQGITNENNANFGACTKCVLDPFNSCATRS